MSIKHPGLYGRLKSVEHNTKTISEMRRIELYYQEVFCGLFGGDDIESEPLRLALKNRMQLFLLAYALGKDRNENFDESKRNLDGQLTVLKDKENLTHQEKDDALGNIINNFLGESLAELQGEGNENILKNIIGGYWMQYLGGDEKDFFEDEDILEDSIVNIKKGTREGADEILGSQGYLEAEDKAQYLLIHGFSYKRGIEVYYGKIKSKCFDCCTNGPDDIANKMQKFNIAYILCKYKFQDTTRSSGERYFEHLLSVLDLYLDNEENPTFEGAMIAMLHDIVEDSDIDKDTLEWLFGKDIAEGVAHLSKTSVQPYLEEQEDIYFFEQEAQEGGILNCQYKISDDIERKIEMNCLTGEEYEKVERYKKIHAQYKGVRNSAYFTKFLRKGIEKKLDDEAKRNISIKCYDRIHNTQTLLGMGDIEKILQKVDETIAYFLPITQQHFPKIHAMLISELERVLDYLMSNMTHYSRSNGKGYRASVRERKRKIRDMKVINERVIDIVKKS